MIIYFKENSQMNIFKRITNYFQHLFNQNQPEISATSSKKKAVILAISDYPSWQNDLKGPKNDAIEWHTLLQKNGYEVSTLVDKQCLKKSVKNLLKETIQGMKAGKLIIVYSGHGTQLPDNNSDESDLLDESWCFYDSFFLDDDLRNILKLASKELMITVISDSCFAGTMTRDYSDYSVKKKRVKRIGKPHKDVEAREILLAGSSENESGYEGMIDGKPRGAFSYYAIKILNEQPEITVSEFGKELEKHLPCNEFPQHPVIDCLEDMIDKQIL